MRSYATLGDVTLLWYELGRLYAAAAEDARRASMVGFAVVCAIAALVLLSAPLFGTAWMGLFAPGIPILAGLIAGNGYFGWRRARFSRRCGTLGWALAAEGADAKRPTAGGLYAYYDTQLILLRSEYEFLINQGTKRAFRSAWLFEVSFGFTPEDGFECGPLNIVPDTQEMRALKERWEDRLSAKHALDEAPPLGLREDIHYRVFPREMTVQAELTTRAAYLEISYRMIRHRYGRRWAQQLPEALRRRVERDLEEYAAISGRRVR